MSGITRNARWRYGFLHPYGDTYGKFDTRSQSSFDLFALVYTGETGTQLCCKTSETVPLLSVHRIAERARVADVHVLIAKESSYVFKIMSHLLRNASLTALTLV